MTKAERERIEQLKEKAGGAQSILNSIRQELEDMGRKRDTARFTKIVDLISEWREE